MKEKPSKQLMEPQLDLLSTLKKAQPDPALYAAIKQRINQQKEQSVPWAFLQAVAAIFVVMFATQIYFTSTTTLTDSEDVSALVTINSNTLYDEY